MVILLGWSNTYNPCCGSWLGHVCITVWCRGPGCGLDPAKLTLQGDEVRADPLFEAM